ncbi:MAG: hypothetical protein V1487_02965 [bacterium]
MSKTFGKVILSGEHAVVYGKTAIVASIGLGVRVKTVGKGKSDYNPVVAKAIEIAGGSQDLKLEIESDLPVGSGLGSSAAVAAAVIKEVRKQLGKPIDQDELFRLTLECEKIAHGNPSGIDPAAVVYGGLIAYTKGQPLEQLLVKRQYKLLLVDTGKPVESTKEMVEMVANSVKTTEVIEKITYMVREIKDRLGRKQDIGNCINQNGLLLEELGVVGEDAIKLSNKLRSLGADVKITGAGGVQTGSGMMIVMSSDLAKFKEFLDNKQFKYFETIVGGKQ